MSASGQHGESRGSGPAVALVLATRLTLAALFLWMGLEKALHPVEFLKLVRAYNIVHGPWALNVIAAGLPWLEVFCGVMLLLGIAVRGTALVVAGMLVPFTLAVLWRAWGLHVAGSLPFCAIKFDCGCGGGEVYICGKVLENAAMLAAALFLATRRVRLNVLAVRP